MKLVFSTLLYSLCLATADHTRGSCSSYSFRNEPPEELGCNPYLNPNLSDIALKCSITGPKLPANISHISIEWYRLLEGEQERESLTELAELSPQLVEIDDLPAATSNGDIMTSILRIVDVTVNDVAGMYWCVVILNIDVSEVSHLEFHSDRSTITTIRRATDLLDDKRECGSEIQTSVSTHCVSFQVLPPDPLPGGTSLLSNSLVTSGSSVSGSGLSTSGDSAGGPPILSTSMIIILSGVGGGLCLIIHVLLAVVGGLCIKNRRRKRVRRGIMDHRKISSVSLLSTPSPLPSLPSPDAPQRVLSRDADSQLSKPLPAIANTQPSPNFKPLPPIPTSKPPVLQNRTLPSRFTQQVTRLPPQNQEEPNYDVYAPPQLGPAKPRAATFAGELRTLHITPDSDSSIAEDDRKYKSLDRSRMDDRHPHYEDPRAGDWDAYDDDDSENEECPYATTTSIIGSSDDSKNVETGMETYSIPLTVDHPKLSLTTEQGTSSMLLSPNIANSTSPSSQSMSVASLRSKSPLLAVISIPLARESVDGEYVLPNEAYGGGLLSPPNDNELPDYIDIS